MNGRNDAKEGLSFYRFSQDGNTFYMAVDVTKPTNTIAVGSENELSGGVDWQETPYTIHDAEIMLPTTISNVHHAATLAARFACDDNAINDSDINSMTEVSADDLRDLDAWDWDYDEKKQIDI